VQRTHRGAQRGRQRRNLGKEHGARAYRQRGEHQNVTPVGERGVPTQHREEADHQHRGGNQKVLRTPGENQTLLRGHPPGAAGKTKAHDRKRHTQKDEQGRKLAVQFVHIALGMS